MGAEFIRLGLADAFTGKQVVDSMTHSVDYCALPGGRGGKFKYPKLEELHFKLFGKGFSTAHNACADVEATTRCFFGLLHNEVIRIEDHELDAKILSYLDSIAPKILGSINDELLKKNEETKKHTSKTIKVDVTNIHFSHLHNHTQYSILQATSSIEDIIKKAVASKQKAIAITDCENMFGAFAFWQAIDKHNKTIKVHNEAIEAGTSEGEKKEYLKAIIGTEINITKNRLDRTSQNNGYSQVFLAKNQIGYQNLSKLSSISRTEGFYYVPRIDKDILLQYKEGLIVTTGGLTSEIPSLILNEGEGPAEAAFSWWLEQFGEDFYIELNRHNLEDENYVNSVLLGFAEKYGVKYFAANNNYYVEKAQANAHDILLCIKDGELQETQKGRGRGFRFGFPNDEFYFKTTEEMLQLFHDIPEALEVTNEIVDKIESFKLGRDVLLPKFQIPPDFADQNAYLKHLTYIGAAKRYPDLTQDIKDRLDFELATIERMGFPGYFLIVQDFTSKAREMGVSVGPGRGSAAGSAIAYCLGITNVDPIKYALLFERFLNPDRISMPDIDIDFDDEGRDKVIQYVVEKYGAQQVAQITTYGTLGGKSALRDTARALNLPLPDADKLAKSFPESPDAELKKMITPNGIQQKLKDKLKDKPDQLQKAEDFFKLSQTDTLQAQVIKQATELEGCLRNTGTHACGIIITPDELTKFVPVYKAKDSEMLVTQFDNSVAESAGLLKMDFLGLRTLTIIKDTVRLIEKTRGITIDVDEIPLDDPLTFELFQKGRTKGIFQFESTGMQKYLKELKPDRFDELIAMNALYRPGPLAYIPNFIKRKHGYEPITFDLEVMEPYLKDTYGITVYQEQVMLLSQAIANFTKGDADVLRKAMGKKDKATLDKMKSKFISGAQSNGHDATVCEKIWTDWEAFAQYAFNKSHSTCYAYIAYHTAYLKAHYTSEFLAANLTHNMGTTEQVAFYMAECKELGVDVLGPDVNESDYKFSVNKKGQIRVGMGALKGVGENVVLSIMQEREANGFFKSVFDLTSRVERNVNKRVLESLAYSGAFDGFQNLTRAHYFATEPNDNVTFLEKAVKYGNSIKESQNSSQVSLFGEATGESLPEPKAPKCEPWSDLVKLKYEKDVIGMYVSGHPLDSYQLEMNNFCNATLSDLKNKELLKGRDLTIAGMVTSIQHKVMKNGNLFGVFVLEDYNGKEEFAVFRETYLTVKPYMIEGLLVLIKGKVDYKYRGSEEIGFNVVSVQLISEVRNKLVKDVTLQINPMLIDEDKLEKLYACIQKHKGNVNLKVELYDLPDKISLSLFSKNMLIEPSNEFFNELNALGFDEYEVNKSPDMNFIMKSIKRMEAEVAAVSNNDLNLEPEFTNDEN